VSNRDGVPTRRIGMQISGRLARFFSAQECLSVRTHRERRFADRRSRHRRRNRRIGPCAIRSKAASPCNPCHCRTRRTDRKIERRSVGRRRSNPHSRRRLRRRCAPRIGNSGLACSPTTTCTPRTVSRSYRSSACRRDSRGWCCSAPTTGDRSRPRSPFGHRRRRQEGPAGRARFLSARRRRSPTPRGRVRCTTSAPSLRARSG
jgi:hypothetical protein